MSTLSALLLATPIFGFSLTPPSLAVVPAPEATIQPAARLTLATPRLLLEVVDAPEAEGGGAETPTEPPEPTTPDAAAPDETDQPQEEEETTPEEEVPLEDETAQEEPPPQEPLPEPAPSPFEPTIPPPAEVEPDQVERSRAAEETQVEAATDMSFDQLARQGQQRRQLRIAHMTMGIATWASMAATVTLGALQYADEYGAADYDDTRCAQGNAILGQWNCDTPWAHMFSVIVTTSLYATTFGLSLALEQDDAQRLQERRRTNERLRMHRTLRWVHLALVAAQIVEGLIFANLGNMGVDEREHHNVLQGLNAFHLAVGAAAFTTVTWAGALMLF